MGDSVDSAIKLLQQQQAAPPTAAPASAAPDPVASAIQLLQQNSEPKLSLSDQIPGNQAVYHQPEPEPSWSDKIAAGAKAVARTGLGMLAAPVAGWGAMATHGIQGPQAATSQFQKNMASLLGAPSTPLEQQYTEAAAPVMNSAMAMLGHPGEMSALASSRPVGAVQDVTTSALRPDGPLRQAILDPMAQTAGGAIGGPGAFAKGAGAILTWKNPASIQRIFDDARAGNPSAAQAMRGKVPVDQILTDAKMGIDRAQQAMYEQYRTAKSGWAADTTTLDFAPIDDAFSKLQGSVEVGGKSLIGKPEQAKIAEVGQVLDEWRSDPSMHTTLGLDALKRRIDAIYPESPRQTQAQRVITGTRNAVKDAIVQQAPDYADAMKTYDEQFNTIKDINRALSLGDKVAKDSALKKLSSLAGYDQKFRQAMAEQLKERGGTDIMGQVAGNDMSNWMPERLGTMNAMGIGGLGWMSANPLAAAAIMPFTSPRVIGEIAHGAGKVAGLFTPKSRPAPAPEALPALNPAAQNTPLPEEPGAAPVLPGTDMATLLRGSPEASAPPPATVQMLRESLSRALNEQMQGGRPTSNQQQGPVTRAFQRSLAEKLRGAQ